MFKKTIIISALFLQTIAPVFSTEIGIENPNEKIDIFQDENDTGSWNGSIIEGVSPIDDKSENGSWNGSVIQLVSPTENFSDLESYFEENDSDEESSPKFIIKELKEEKKEEKEELKEVIIPFSPEVWEKLLNNDEKINILSFLNTGSLLNFRIVSKNNRDFLKTLKSQKIIITSKNRLKMLIEPFRTKYQIIEDKNTINFQNFMDVFSGFDLNFSLSELTIEHIKILSEKIQNNQFGTLLAQFERLLTEEGLITLSNALEKNTTVLSLIFNENYDLKKSKLDYFFDMLKKNSSITHLGFTCNGLNDEHAGYFASMLKINKSLQFVDLTGGYITDTGALEVNFALQENNTLKELCLNRNMIGKKGREALELTAKRKGITIDLFDNYSVEEKKILDEQRQQKEIQEKNLTKQDDEDENEQN